MVIGNQKSGKMLTKEQLKILSVFKKRLFFQLTFRQIKEKAKQKSNNLIQRAIKEFKKQEIIKTKKTGDVTTYSLNYDNNLTCSYLNLINDLEIAKNKLLPKEILNTLQWKISRNTQLFILIVFGSYVKSNADEKSDLDIAVIVKSEETKKEILPFIETLKRRELRNIDYHVFTEADFIEMLNEEQENLGKQIYKNSIIYYNFISYLNMIRKENE